MSLRQIRMPLMAQLNDDEQLFREENVELVESVQAVRKLAMTPGWLEAHQGMSVAVHQGLIVATERSQYAAYNKGIEVSGTTNIYVVGV